MTTSKYLLGFHQSSLYFAVYHKPLRCLRSLSEISFVRYFHAQTQPAESLPDKAVRQQVSCLNFRCSLRRQHKALQWAFSINGEQQVFPTIAVIIKDGHIYTAVSMFRGSQVT